MKSHIKLVVLLPVIILAVLTILPGCRSEIKSNPSTITTSPIASQLANPQYFRSNLFHLDVQIPSGWAAVEGPQSLARSKIKGYVALNSWGQAGFWAHEVFQDNVESYSPQAILSQVPQGGTYVVLDELVSLAHSPGSESTEYILNDLSGLITPRDWRKDTISQTQSFAFLKWGKLLQFYVVCQPDASDITVSALNSLLQSWKFDEITP